MRPEAPRRDRHRDPYENRFLRTRALNTASHQLVVYKSPVARSYKCPERCTVWELRLLTLPEPAVTIAVAGTDAASHPDPLPPLSHSGHCQFPALWNCHSPQPCCPSPAYPIPSCPFQEHCLHQA